MLENQIEKLGNNLPVVIVSLLFLGVGAVGIGQATNLDVLPANIASNQCNLGSTETVEIRNGEVDKIWYSTFTTGCDNKITGGSTTLPKEMFQDTDNQGNNIDGKRDFTSGFTDFKASIGLKVDTAAAQPVREMELNKIECSVEDWDFEPGNPCDDDERQQCAEWQDNNKVPGGKTYSIELEDFFAFEKPYQFCFAETSEEGETASFAGGVNKFSGTFKAEAGGESDSDTISSSDTTASLNVGDVNGDGEGESAQITYLGSFQKGFNDINSDIYQAACTNDCSYSGNGASWHVTEERDVSGYWDYRNRNGFAQCVDDMVRNNNNPIGCVATYNSKADAALSNNDEDFKDTVNRLFNVEKLEVSNNEIRAVASNPNELQSPNFRMRVDADWIGSVTPIGDPEITNIPNPDVTGTDSRRIELSIKNNGENQGLFEVGMSCPRPLNDDSSRTRTISPGGTDTVSLQLSSGPSETKDYECTLTAQDTEASSPQDTARMSVGVTTSFKDGDGDGIKDANDKCPNEYAPGTDDGCLNDQGTDSDNDGILDKNDQCPTRSETPQKLLDEFDTSKEIVNRYEDSDGCPDKSPSGPQQEICTNNKDNDGDGLLPSRDPDCQKEDDNTALILGGLLALVIGYIAYQRFWIGFGSSSSGRSSRRSSASKSRRQKAKGILGKIRDSISGILEKIQNIIGGGSNR